jgi:hypothetical protein
LGKNWILLIIPTYAKVSTYYKRLIRCLILAQPKPMGRSLLIALIPTKTSKQHRQVSEKWVSDDYAKVSKLKQISVPIPINMTFMLCLIPKRLSKGCYVRIQLSTWEYLSLAEVLLTYFFNFHSQNFKDLMEYSVVVKINIVIYIGN